MSDVLKGYEPQALFSHFEDLTAIPHGSGNEKEIADHLVAFAGKNGLEVYRDGMHNVLIKRPAAPGKEDRPPVILQGHSDMVCEKEEGVAHDFEKDPLDLYVEDGWLRARGTTLGADDGVAVAMILALLEEKDLDAPALECLITTQEEIGMHGAMHFDYSRLAGRRLINLDSDTPSLATVSCAGSCVCRLDFAMEKAPSALPALAISLGGLCGGHSGGKIQLGRANAILLLGRLLRTVYEAVPFALVSFSGGGKNNAIPREAKAVIAVENLALAEKTAADFAEALKKEMLPEDRELAVELTETSAPAAFTLPDTRRFLDALALAPNGVQSRVPSDAKLVESSSNLGIAQTGEEGIFLSFMPRSSSEAKLDDIMLRFQALARSCGARCQADDRHPGWEYAEISPLRDAYCAVHETLFGTQPEIRVTHAGLECGIISGGLGGVDAVSFGPGQLDVHTPQERLNLESFAKCYQLVKELLATL